MTDFKREDRYIVFKLRHLDDIEKDSVLRLSRSLNAQPFDCVVVESDWPNYEQTWKSIESVSEGSYSDPYAEIEQLRARVVELEKDAARYRYIRANQYWTRSEGNDIDPGFSCVGTKFAYSDDFSARIMLDHHIDRRLRDEAEKAGGEQ